MRKIGLLLAAFLMLSLCGCIITSLHPLYDNDDLIFEPALLGSWEEVGDDFHATFEKREENSYLIDHLENKEHSRFTGHLVKIGDELFLDVVPDGESIELHDVLTGFVIPVHSFYRITPSDKTLQLAGLDFGWLENYLEANPSAVGHTILDGNIVFTASTKEMQAFLLKHLHTEGAFEEASLLNKIE